MTREMLHRRAGLRIKQTPIGADEQGVKTPWRRAPTELGLSEARGLERCALRGSVTDRRVDGWRLAYLRDVRCQG